MTDDRSSVGIRSPSNSSNDVSPESSNSAPTVVNSTTRNKKVGFGSKLKALVRISIKRSSAREKDSMQGAQVVPSTPPRLVRKIVEQFEESDSSSSSSGSSFGSGEEFREQLWTVTEVNEDEYNSDVEPMPTNAISDNGASSESPAHPKKPFISKRFGGGNNVKITNPISLVILLIDPTFQQFELLRLQHDQPKKLRIKNVLTYFQSSIKNNSFNELKFLGLLDRKGRIHGPSAKLSMAVSHERDILVGLVEGVQDASKLMNAARPILGDSSVGKLV